MQCAGRKINGVQPFITLHEFTWPCQGVRQNMQHSRVVFNAASPLGWSPWTNFCLEVSGTGFSDSLTHSTCDVCVVMGCMGSGLREFFQQVHLFCETRVQCRAPCAQL